MVTWFDGLIVNHQTSR